MKTIITDRRGKYAYSVANCMQYMMTTLGSRGRDFLGMLRLNQGMRFEANTNVWNEWDCTSKWHVQKQISLVHIHTWPSVNISYY